MTKDYNEKDDATSYWVRGAFGLIAVASLGVVWKLLCLVTHRGDTMSPQIDHRAWALIVMSIAGCLATALVTGLRAIDGEMTFELIGIKATRAGALLVGWLAAFVVIVLSFHALR